MKNQKKELATLEVASTRYSALGYVSHAEAAERIAQLTSKITTKEQARKLLRSAGILTKKNKLKRAVA